jgi:hypothetical protein
MIEPHPAQYVLADLIAHLGFLPAEPDKAFGSAEGSPAAMTILGCEPLALLFAFKIRSPHPAGIVLPNDIAALVDAKRAEASLENGVAWLSLDDLTGETAASIAELVASFARRLAETDVALPEGCAECPSRDSVELVYASGRCSRLCAECRNQLDEEIEQRDQKLNGFDFAFALTLPVMCVYVSVVWSFLWVALDLVRERRQSDVLIVHPLAAIIVLGILAAVAGYPVGVFSRRLGLTGFAKWAVSAGIVLLSCAIGEWLYVVWTVDNQIGIFDPLFAARVTVDFVAGYQPSWKFAKAIVTIAITAGCCLAMRVRHSVEVTV